MVNRVDVAIEEGSTHGVGSCANHKVAAHHISLKASSLQASDVLSNANKYLATKMTALLNSWLLVFQVNATSA